MSSPPPISTTAFRPLPARKTYGRKRFPVRPSESDSGVAGAPAKRNRFTPSPRQPHPGTQTPLQDIHINAPSPLNFPPRSHPPPQPTYPSNLTSRRTADQNALDSPFTGLRNSNAPCGIDFRSGIRHFPPVLKSRVTSDARSRHLSLNRPYSNNPVRDGKETPAETLRRKTSEATTTSGATASKHSWLIPPPPRAKFNKDALRVAADTPMFDFTFDPPAESTVAYIRRAPRTTLTGVVGDILDIGGSEEVPLVQRTSLRHEVSPATPPKGLGRLRKQHDSILSSDSEDLATSFSIFGLTPKPKLNYLLIEEPEVTPRNIPPLIEQLCGHRSRSGSVSLRSLDQSVPVSVPPLSSSSDTGDERAEESLPEQDTSVHVLVEDGVEMDLDDDSSPSRLIKATSKDKRRSKDNKKQPIGRVQHSNMLYQLSPRTVYRLSKQRRVGMRIDNQPLSPNNDADMFASYEFDRGAVKEAGH
ncbi:hypothetical protein RhiLY_01866 [Ceratobasidium sp. AG-Ba]|nr:hypothetical protein RhiLY_01866 [Ceratobasidium sp. AG-Ba]